MKTLISRATRGAAVIAGTVLLASASVRSQQPQPRPTLVVLVMVDQMRADYLERYGGLIQDGLHRLTTHGAYYVNAAFPYANTVTCAGHSTVATGTFPYQHGMIMNGWFVRDAGVVETCTEDPEAKKIGYGRVFGPGDSARRLLRPTVAELLRRDGGGRTVSLSLKARSAIGMAGHDGDLVLWFDDAGGVFTTSSAYARAADPAIASWMRTHPIEAMKGRVWDRLLPRERYQYDEEQDTARPTFGWSAGLPHAFGSDDRTFYSRWQQSPFSDDYLEQLAEAAIENMKLGQGSGTDFLGISFSALDLVGHAYGPRSHEVQDVLARLDLTVQRLLNFLDARVGEDRYLLALSSDHGVADIPEQVGGTRLSSETVVRLIDETLRARWTDAPPKTTRDIIRPFTGEGTYVANVVYTDVYLQPGVYDRLKKDPATMTAVRDALKEIPAVSDVLRGDTLSSAAARTSDDPMARAVALSYMPGRSGDLVIIPVENAIAASTATTHGTARDYDQRVPIILYGNGVRAGVYTEPVTPADIAVTFAQRLGLRLPSPDGHVLSAAVAPPLSEPSRWPLRRARATPN